MPDELTILDLVEHAATSHRMLALTSKQCAELLKEVEVLEDEAFQEGLEAGITH